MTYEFTPARRTVLAGSLAATLGATLVGTRAAADAPASSAAAATGPFHVVDGLIDTSDENALGLPPAANAETVTIFAPGDEDLKFNHGVVLIPFAGRLYAQWQSSERDEDAPETIVTYAVSEDGLTWSEPIALTEPRADGYTSSGGWWTDGETLVAYLNVWPASLEPRGGYTEYVTSSDGVTWSDPQPVTDADGNPVLGIIEQDTRALPSGRLLTAFHVQPGLFVKPYYTDDPLGLTGWTQGEFENQPNVPGEMSRELEPSWYVRPDGAVVMVFRDQGGNTMLKLGAVSEDDGETWTESELTNVPDSRTKQSAGTLPDGTAFLVGNPTGTKNRYPLSILLSADGVSFDVGYGLRDTDDLQERRYEGQYKSSGYSYPKSVLAGGYLYAAYGTNKEDVEYTRVPVEDLSLRSVPEQLERPTAWADSGRRLHVAWDPATGEGDSPVTGYVVTATSRSGRSVEVSVGANERRTTITGVHPGRYQVSVAAKNGYGAGEASEPSAWVVVTGRPAHPGEH
ncbi:exo-alpha-sialidase [Ruania zhangjianzhongii]|uniref:exo-alpha-sialidase n=1 Tax=Ruania zhangjianzhongii TaxID=2603206 RepID=UPI00143D754D|nr:exo-alpha-sialidase [Ruania zhangjianzhongii]